MFNIDEVLMRLEKIKEKVEKLKRENQGLKEEVEELKKVRNKALEKVDGIIAKLNQEQG